MASFVSWVFARTEARGFAAVGTLSVLGALTAASSCNRENARAAPPPMAPLVTATAAVSRAVPTYLDEIGRNGAFESVGPALAQTLFDAGLRRATVEQYEASFNQAVASYRGTVLTAFQQVEDNLAALRILAREIQQQDTAVESAARNLRIATARYRAGIDPYLNVITAQTTLLSNQQTAVTLRRQQMTASVQLVEALGGSWNLSDLPSATQVTGHGR